MEIVLIVLAVIAAGCLFFMIGALRNARSATELKGQVQGFEGQLKAKDSLVAEVRESEARRYAELQSRFGKAESDLAEARKELATCQSNLAALRERTVISEQERERLLLESKAQFRNLANEIFEANSKRFKENTEQRLGEILNPLRENIDDFRKAVATAYNDESKERFSLRNEIRNLMELNRSIGREAKDLTRALRGDAKLQGDWGEMILERLLEKSGLQKGVHFDQQVTTDTDGSRLVGEGGTSLRADVVVYYPDDRCLVIDSKVSLTAFVDYANSGDDDPEARSEAERRHLLSVRSHIKELASKNYQDLIGKKRMDFVMMFIPNEAAYIAAMQIEPGLWQEAYDKRVLIVSPTHLISILRMLDQLWKQDAVTRNVEEIARLSGKMLDKLSGFIDSMDGVEKGLVSARKAYDEARNRLSEGNGNVMITAKKIIDLGAKTTKAASITRNLKE